jgi:hypothetical protein
VKKQNYELKNEKTQAAFLELKKCTRKNLKKIEPVLEQLGLWH